jgi:2-dehydro-3-deoxy-D-arabinonate dehydratase
MKVYSTADGLVVESEKKLFLLPSDHGFDRLFTASDTTALLRTALAQSKQIDAFPSLHAPLQSQEIWAAGVTYLRSRTARMEESKDAGGGTFYDKVYNAVRPELFFKGTAHRTAGPGEQVHLRRDSKWNVPEPELTLAVNAQGKIFGYTIGNDMSSRDIEGENPLYLPQAKVYHRSGALGPCLYLTDQPLPVKTEIAIEIQRSGKEVFSGQTDISQIKRSFTELAEFLFRDNSFPVGCYLMTGTGVVPPDNFTLQSGDKISITIAPIGTLVNVVL